LAFENSDWAAAFEVDGDGAAAGACARRARRQDRVAEQMQKFVAREVRFATRR